MNYKIWADKNIKRTWRYKLILQSIEDMKQEIVEYSERLASAKAGKVIKPDNPFGFQLLSKGINLMSAIRFRTPDEDYRKWGWSEEEITLHHQHEEEMEALQEQRRQEEQSKRDIEVEISVCKDGIKRTRKHIKDRRQDLKECASTPIPDWRKDNVNLEHELWDRFGTLGFNTFRFCPNDLDGWFDGIEELSDWIEADRAGSFQINISYHRCVWIVKLADSEVAFTRLKDDLTEAIVYTLLIYFDHQWSMLIGGK